MDESTKTNLLAISEKMINDARKKYNKAKEAYDDARIELQFAQKHMEKINQIIATSKEDSPMAGDLTLSNEINKKDSIIGSAYNLMLEYGTEMRNIEVYNELIKKGYNPARSSIGAMMKSLVNQGKATKIRDGVFKAIGDKSFMTE